MYAGKTVFSQLMDCVPWSTFSRLVARYRGDYDVRTFPCVEQFRAMAFAQLTYRESCATLRRACRLNPRSVITWVFAGRSDGRLWQMPMKPVIGAFMLNSPND